MEGLNPLGGRFQTRLSYVYNTTLDLKGTAPGDLAIYPVNHGKIELTAFGYEVMTATGAFTIASVLQLAIIPYQNGTRVAPINAKAVLTAVASQPIYSTVWTGLNLNEGVGPPAYPVAYRGDVLIFQLLTQGTGTGAQDVRPWIHFRERPLT